MSTQLLQGGQPITWNKVFNYWRENETGPNSHWNTFWPSQGFKSWEEWRQHTHANLHGEQLSWELYDMADPLELVPTFRGGPFRSWTKWFYSAFNSDAPTFAELVQHPGVSSNWFILELAKNFPDKSVITGVRTPDGIVIVEGMHRCCALALRAKWNKSLNGPVPLVLAEYPNKLPMLGAEKK